MAITIIETGSPPESVLARCGQTADWFLAALAKIGKKADVIRPYLGEKLPEPVSVTAAIITGSWSMVTDREEWSERIAEWIRKAMPFDIPLFGVCYGHQLMAHALGGIVGDNPAGGETRLPISNDTGSKRNLLLDNFPENFPCLRFSPPKRIETTERLRHSGRVQKRQMPDTPLWDQCFLCPVSS